MRRAFRLAGIVTVCGLALVVASSAPLAQRPLTPHKIEINSREIAAFDPAKPEQRRFGALEFRGGLVLSVKDRNFGGISGLHIYPDGENFLAHSDRGFWIRGKLKLMGDRVVAIENAEIAPMRGPDGRTLFSRRWHDTEALTADGETFYVGIERRNQILRYRFGAEGFAAPGIPIQVPRGIRELPYNQGLEGLAFVPKGMPLAGSLLAISERGLDRNGNILSFILGGATPGSFTIKRNDNFEVSDAAISPSGHLVVLERYFRFFSGIHLRIRAIPLAQIKPNALVDGETLIEAGPNFEIDNMEALAITKNAAGEIILTLLSDDNFNAFQRTILLRFAWTPK
jgi:hypothetical protein